MADRIQRGESARPPDLEHAYGNSDAIPSLIRLALVHSSNRELLAASLRQAASLYRERAEGAATWYTEYVPILLTVGIGGTLVACFTLSVLWPYAATLREIARFNWH